MMFTLAGTPHAKRCGLTIGPKAIDWPVAREVIWRVLIVLIALAILVVVTTRWNRWQGAAGWQQTDDAYLQSDLTPIAAKVPGYVRAVPVQDFDHVRAGQLIAEIVDDDYKATVAQATANVAAAEASIGTLKAQAALQAANVDAAHAVIASTNASLDQNSRDTARQRTLLATGSSSTEATEKLSTTR